MENQYNAGSMPRWNAFLREQLAILEKEKRVKPIENLSECRKTAVQVEAKKRQNA